MFGPIQFSVGLFLLVTTSVAGQVPRDLDQLPVTVRIPTEGRGYALARPRSSLLLRSGEMLVIEGADATVLRFDRSGAFVGKFGRRGGGPGEYTDPSSLLVYGDSILVWDPGLSRLSVVSLDGRLGRTVAVRAPGAPILARDGKLLTVSMREYGGAGEFARQWLNIIARDSLGLPIDTVFSRSRGYRSLRVPHAAGGTTVGAQPFDDGALSAVSQYGEDILWVDRATDKGGAFTLSVFDLQGRTRFTRRIAYSPMPITSAMVDAAVARLLRPGATAAEFKRAFFIPQSMPTVTQAFFLADGGIVLRREESFGGPSRYTVLDSIGNNALDIVLPPNAVITSGTSRMLLILLRDADGVPSYQISRIR